MTLFLGILLAVLLLVAAFVCFWLFAIAPRLGNRPDMTLLRRYDYAHRGLHSAAVPENSLSAFRLATDQGFGIELDLQLTLDGEIVVHHDNDVSRMCGVKKNISDMTLKEVSTLQLSGSTEGIPRFSQVLEVVDGRTPLILELKYYGRREELCEKAMALLRDYKGPFCIESFDPLIVAWFRKHAPQVVRGQLMSHFRKGDNGLGAVTAFLGRNLFSNLMSRPDFEAYDCQYRKNLSLRLACRLFHMQEVSWTVRNKETFIRLKRDGCICIFEDFDPRGLL